MTTTKIIVQKYIDFCKKNNIHIKLHQIYGVLWCIRKERESVQHIQKCNGGIIADQMGMGKTIQMIITIFLNFKKNTLIILPPILVKQWFSEIWRILGHKCCLFYGQNRRHSSFTESKIVITSYDTFLRSPELLEIHWNRVICDEAHRLRNPKTKLYIQIQKIHTDILWCITGTPIHNKVKDIMSLFHLYSEKKSKNPQDYISMVLRRDNSILNIPEKTEIIKMIPWNHSGEKKIANDIHSTIANLGFDSLQSECSFWNTTKISELVTFIRAKQLCILPKLLEKSFQKIEKEDPDHLFPDDFKNTTTQNTSCKIRALIHHILLRVNNEKGKIIFCHFQLEMTNIIDLLRENTDPNFIWVGNWKEFQNRSDFDIRMPILILQIRTGCEGLNLQTQFSEIYFVSPNWNPTLEDQAIARCHRIGQKNPVFVFRFYMDSLLSETELTEQIQNNKDIEKYTQIVRKLPNHIRVIIHDYLQNDSVILKKHNYSMDQYTLFKQNEKKEKIMEFMQNITKK
jgi:non-specific serine/threonine protein kinase